MLIVRDDSAHVPCRGPLRQRRPDARHRARLDAGGGRRSSRATASTFTHGPQARACSARRRPWRPPSSRRCSASRATSSTRSSTSWSLEEVAAGVEPMPGRRGAARRPARRRDPGRPGLELAARASSSAACAPPGWTAPSTVIVTGEEVARAQAGARRLRRRRGRARGRARRSCAVLEDSPTGRGRRARGRGADDRRALVPGRRRSRPTSWPRRWTDPRGLAARWGSRRRPPKLDRVPLASLGDDISSFFDAVGKFFSSLADIHFGALLIALVAFGLYLTIRSRACVQHPARRLPATSAIEFRRIWGAYIAAYGFNNVIPARGGDVIRLFLTKTSVPELELLGGGGGDLRRDRLRRDDGRLHPHLRLHAGRVPQAAGLLQARARSTCRSSPAHLALHAVPAHRARRRSGSSASRCSRAACGRSGRACARA